MSVSEFLQDEAEFARFVQIVRYEGIRSFLEIGSKFGGSLRRVALAMPAGSRVVSVDLPNGTRAWRDSEGSLNQTIKWLSGTGYDAHLIWGNSQDAVVVERVRRLGPFDAVFIDADHRLPGVTADGNNYRAMASKLVAFHDIGWHRADTWIGTRIDVPEFWDSIKDGFQHEEIKLCPTGKNNGIGVLWV